MQLAIVASILLSCYHQVSSIDPDVYLDAEGLITSKGYPCELHNTTTEDGYIISMERIPASRNGTAAYKGAVFLMHCLECDSTVFITNFPNQSLGFILADAGYDVWLGNVRGTIYSRHSTKYLQSEYEFWAWTWDDISRYDLPAFVNYVRNATGEDKIFYVGHSQGTMVMFAALSWQKELASHIKLFSALAPVARLGNITSPLRYGSPWVERSQWVYRLFQYGKFFPPTHWMNQQEVMFCRNTDLLFKPACVFAYYFSGGFEQQHQLNTSRLDVYFGHTPSGTSTRNVNHYAQQVESGLFQAYDFRTRHSNKKHYNGHAKPPQYPVQHITVPIGLFSGKQDSLADPADVAWLESQLQTVVFSRQYDQFQHLDFIWGLRAGETVYADLLQLMAQY